MGLETPKNDAIFETPHLSWFPLSSLSNSLNKSMRKQQESRPWATGSQEETQNDIYTRFLLETSEVRPGQPDMSTRHVRAIEAHLSSKPSAF